MKKVQYEDACVVKDMIMVMISMLPSKKDRKIIISGLQRVLVENSQLAKSHNSTISSILNITMEDYLIAWLDGVKDSTGIEHVEILVDSLN